MAELRDISKVMRWMGPWSFLKQMVRQAIEDRLIIWGSAMAYSWLFAIFPFIIFLLTFVPYLSPDIRDTAKTEIFRFIDAGLPREAANTVRGNISMVMEHPRPDLRSIGILIALWAASGGVAVTMSALDECYDIERGRTYLRKRLLAILLTLVMASLMVAVAVLLPIGTVVLNWLWEHAEAWHIPLGWLVALQIARWALALVFMFAVLAILYRFGPKHRVRFHTFTPGAVFTVAVWLLLGLGFRFYVDHIAHYDQMYGTVGGVAVLLLLFYLDAVVLLVGAELNSEIDCVNTAEPIDRPAPAPVAVAQ